MEYREYVRPIVAPVLGVMVGWLARKARRRCTRRDQEMNEMRRRTNQRVQLKPNSKSLKRRRMFHRCR